MEIPCNYIRRLLLLFIAFLNTDLLQIWSVTVLNKPVYKPVQTEYTLAVIKYSLYFIIYPLTAGDLNAASRKSSISPSITRITSPVSCPVLRSFTIVYG